MFSYVLECPECKFRFNFEKKGNFPEHVTCPHCNSSKSYFEYNAIVLCSQCRGNLRVPVDMASEAGLVCPLCSTSIGTGSMMSDVSGSDVQNTVGEEYTSEKKQIFSNGTFFGNFKIIRLLGRGGMAEVYLAEHLLLKTECAIKVMRSMGAGSDPVFAKRFVREAKLSYRFDHPNIVKVFDAGCDYKTGCMFIAMEYVKGKTLLELANGRMLTEKALLDILESMAEALKILHENNIVHRDIKPSNIMRTNDGVYKLMDLGIAKSEADRAAGEMTLTMDRQTIGTPSYASPEQCRSAHTADIRSDIYSLGATLYHLASGVIPYDGTTSIEIILKVLKHDHVPLKKLRNDISGRLISFIEQMMSSEPSSRPANPDELLKFVHSKDGFWAGAKRLAALIFVPGEDKDNRSGAKMIKIMINIVIALLVFVVLAMFFSRNDNKRSKGTTKAEIEVVNDR